MADVSFLSKRTLVSTKPVQTGKFYNFSVLDHIMEPCHLRLVFYYHTRAEVELGKTTKRLRESFSEMLTNFPVVTGRLQKTPGEYWMVKCNDAGVRMIEASVKGSVEEWLQTADREQELKLIYWEDMFHKPYFWSTFYIQLTEFEGGGIAIGFSCSHLLADAACATMLVQSWADTTLFGKMLSTPHFQSLPTRRIDNKDSSHKLHMDLINYYKAYLERTQQSTVPCTERYSTITFAFSDDMVRKCIADAGVGNADDSKFSPFAALASLFWLSVSKVKGRDRLVNMTICLDGRKPLVLDKGFFGNCMIFNQVSGEKLEKVGLGTATQAVENVIQMTGNETIMDLIEWLESNRNEIRNTDNQPPPIIGPNLMCANWENLNPYTAIFEPRVKPIRVSYYLGYVFGEGQVLILPSPDGGLSRVAMVTLPKCQAAKLCEDDLVLHYSPTILMGLKRNEGSA